MGSLLLLAGSLLRHNHLCRLFPDKGIDQEADSEQDERNAEELSHIEDHIILKGYLRLLDELDQESGTEADNEKNTDECSPVHLLEAIFVEQNQADSEKEIGQGLIMVPPWLASPPFHGMKISRKPCQLPK